MIQVRKAERKKAKLRLGIAAPGGAGKTMGSLFLAYGLTGDWGKIGLLDTEEGSGELYCGTHKDGVSIGEYNYVGLSAPYTVAKYLEGIKALERCSDVVIIDSLTHAWAGTGGLLDKQGKIADQSKNSYTAWRFVTPEHTALVDAMLQSPRHIIATMRSKQEYVLEKNEKGQMAPKKIGMAPVQREGMEYEFTVMFDIDNDTKVAHATKDRTDLFSHIDGAGRVEPDRFRITPATGQKLLAWLNTGAATDDDLCANIAGAINIATAETLPLIYQENGEYIARLTREKPRYAQYITALFNDRAAALGLQ